MSTSQPAGHTNVWMKFVSIEVLFSAGVMLATFYAGYSVLADDQLEQGEDIVAVQAEQKAMATDLSGIKTDVEVIKTEQRHIREDIGEQKDDIKRIRELLERNYPNGGS